MTCAKCEYELPDAIGDYAVDIPGASLRFHRECLETLLRPGAARELEELASRYLKRLSAEVQADPDYIGKSCTLGIWPRRSR